MQLRKTDIQASSSSRTGRYYDTQSTAERRQDLAARLLRARQIQIQRRAHAAIAGAHNVNPQ